jgi:hypothetical protein
MKLRNLFLITLLAGTLSVLGCGDDETGNGGAGATGGDGGTGGSAATGGDGGTGGSAATGGTGGSAATGGTGGSAATGGTGGTGGGAADPCTGGECDNDQARKDACGIGIEYCNSLGAGGEGGSGGAVDPTPEQCGAVGTAICNVDTGAGGNGGAGGNPGGCDWTAVEICALCELSGGIQDCENEFVACLLLDLGGNECEKCSGAALLECFE